ncbi:MAG: 50S ribosomal protein L18Ae [Candidatus Methanoperedens sp.]|nr:50S ribosomal protein L18Ae [Candidatus Methanoperedens sp.]
MNFIVKGTFKAGKKYEPFTKKITTLNKNLASEKVFSLLGSEHRVKRSLVKITSVEEAKE